MHGNASATVTPRIRAIPLQDDLIDSAAFARSATTAAATERNKGATIDFVLRCRTAGHSIRPAEPRRDTPIDRAAFLYFPLAGLAKCLVFGSIPLRIIP